MAKPAKNLEQWGRDTARERYTGGSAYDRPSDEHGNQDPSEKHAEKYDNDTGYVWQHCVAEKKPSFDHSKKRR